MITFERDKTTTALKAVDSLARDNYRREKQRIKEFADLKAEIEFLKQEIEILKNECKINNSNIDQLLQREKINGN